MYGTTYGGGNGGTVWEITVAGAYRVLHYFHTATVQYSDGSSGPDGIDPLGGVAVDAKGNLYGTTQGGGGEYGCGIVWEVAADGTYKDLHDFGGKVINASGLPGYDGSQPWAGVTLDAAGNLYGTATFLGPNNDGMVWELELSSPYNPTPYKDLHDFGGTVSNIHGVQVHDGTSPYGGVTLDKEGNLFGTTLTGGAMSNQIATSGGGIVWEINKTTGLYTDLHDFGGTVAVSDLQQIPDGYFPYGGVTVDGAGNLYGTTSAGGPNTDYFLINNYNTEQTAGVVWRIAKNEASTYSILHSFGEIVNNSYGTYYNGTFLFGGVTLDASGNLYGTTATGGPFLSNWDGLDDLPSGMVWELTNSGEFKDLFDFGYYDDASNIFVGGAYPEAGVTLDSNGNLFGTSGWGPVEGGGGLIWELFTGTPTVQSLTIAPATVLGGSSATATITLSQPAPSGGMAVPVASNSQSATVPNSVTVIGGATSATFNVTTVGVNSKILITITAGSGNKLQSATLTVTPGTLASLNLSPAQVSGGKTSIATISLTGPAGPGGTIVSLTAISSSVSVPPSVLVEGGQISTTFVIKTGGVSSSTSTVITSTLSGSSKSATLTITPAVLTSLSLKPSSIVGGVPVTGTVVLDGDASSAGYLVHLSSNSSVATVPNSVTVLPGQSEANFTVTTIATSSPKIVEVTAINGGIKISENLAVVPPSLVSLILTPTTVPGGVSSIGTVILNGEASASGVVVKLSSSSKYAKVPASLTVAPGKTSATFSITTIPSETTATITANFGTSNQSALLTVTAPALASIEVSPTSVIGGVSSIGTVTLSGPAGTGGIVVDLFSSSPVATVPVSVLVSANKIKATFTVKTVAVASNTLAILTAKASNVSQTASLSIAAPILKSLILMPNNVRGGQSSTGVVTISSPAPAGGLVISLASDQAVVSAPKTTTIPAGKTTSQFSIKTSSVSSKTTATITATEGSSTKSAVLTLT